MVPPPDTLLNYAADNYPRLLSACRRCHPDTDAAADALHRAVLDVHRAVSAGLKVEHPGRYIIGTVYRNRAKDARRPRTVEITTDPPAEITTPPPPGMVDEVCALLSARFGADAVELYMRHLSGETCIRLAAECGKPAAWAARLFWRMRHYAMSNERFLKIKIDYENIIGA